MLAGGWGPEPVLLCAWQYGIYGGWGPFTTYYSDNINETMEYLSNQQGITNGYQLTEIDLLAFRKVSDSAVPNSSGGIGINEVIESSGEVPVRIISITGN